MNERLANILSVILHPLLMPTCLFSILYFISPIPFDVVHFTPYFRLFFIAFTFIYTFVLPAGFIYWLYKSKIVKTLTLNDLQDRKLPYWATATVYFSFGLYLYYQNYSFYPTALILWCIGFVILIVAIISNWWKISAHTAGIGGVLGALLAVYIKFGEKGLWIPAMITLILAGFVASARLKLNAHTPAQVYAGFVVGLIISISGVMLFL